MMYKDIPLPRLLAGTGYGEHRVCPEKVSINMSISPLSEATMELPKGESLPARGYVELYTCMGSAGIYRVRSPEDAYGDNITTVELEHALVEVGDYLVVNKYDEMKAATTAMTTVFSHYRGSLWQLGDISALGSDEIALQANYVRVLEAMIGIMEQKPDCMMTFDFTTTPKWTINIVKRGTTVAAEGRLARNVNYANITYDDTELCTRAYYEKEATTDEVLKGYPVFQVNKLFGPGAYVTHENKLYRLDNGHEKGVTWANTTKTAITDVPTTIWAYEDADTISTYGLIERSVQTGSGYTANEAKRTAKAYLKKHKHPRISVEISAEELSNVTGEAMDTFTIGKKCRLALVDYGVTIERNITGLGFSDVYEQPTNITVNLEEEEDRVINFIHDMDAKGGSGGGGGGGRKTDATLKEYRTRIEQDDYHISLVAEHADRANQILQAAGIDIDANGVAIYATSKPTHLQSKIQVQADRISLVVEGEGPNAHIKPAAIVAAINDGESYIKISADHIDIDGIVDALDAYHVYVMDLDVTQNIYLDGSIECDGDIDCAGEISCSGIEISGHLAYWDSKTVITAVEPHYYSQYMLATTTDGATVSGYVTMAPMSYITTTPDTIYYLRY